MKKLLAVSTACFNPINRELYRRLAQEDGIHLLLVVPEHWSFGRGKVKSAARGADDPEMIFLKPSSHHQRTYRLKGIEQVVKEFKPNVIYLEGDPASVIALSLGRLAKQCKARMMSLSCENLAQDPLSIIKREGWSALPSAIAKYYLLLQSRPLIDVLWVINKEGEKYFQSIGFKHVVLTPLGFNEKIFKPDEHTRIKKRRELGIETNLPVVAYFGRMVPEKGVHLLIEALAELKHLNWKLMLDHFEGYGNDYIELIHSKIVDYQLLDRLIKIKASHEEVAAYMNAADLVVLPSVSTNKWVEQYGRVLPEAMACGKTVLVSSSGAPKEMVWSSDWVFEEGNVKMLKFKIIDYLINSEELNMLIFDYSYKNYGIEAQKALLMEEFN